MRAIASTTPGRPVAGGFFPMPSSMMCLKIKGFATATRASMTSTTRNAISWVLYGAAKRPTRRTVPGASFLPLTDGSLWKDRIMSMGLPGPMGPVNGTP